MFRECKNITEMNLSNFNTTLVTTMDNMFEGCSSLTSVDLTNFNTKLVKTMIFMFSRCSSLTTLDLSFFDTSSVTAMDSMFSHCSSLTSLNISNFNTSSVISMDSMFYECINLEYINLDNFDKRKIRRNMFKNLQKDLVICIKEINKNKFNKALHYQLNSLIIDKKLIIIDCSKDWKTKKKREISSLDNYECKNPMSLNMSLNNDFLSNYIQNSNNENISYCYSYFGEGKSEKEEIIYYDNILNSVKDFFTSLKFVTTNIDKGNDEFIRFEKMMVTFTTSQNQKKNINNKMTNIDLGECENLLRNFYNISSKEILYMKKIDIIQEEMNTLKVEYDIYCKLYGKNLIKLNLTVCANSKVSISIPFSMVGNIDEYNSNSGYYNDVCYSTKTEDGTDITLKDRQRIFIDENKIVCQEDCIFSEYNLKYSKANCLCNARESSKSYSSMKINKDKLLENFKDIKNIANLNILVCYKKLLNKEAIIKNIGFYFLLIIILFHIMDMLIFYFNQFSALKKKIHSIILGVNKIRLIYEGKKGKKKKHNKKIKNKNNNNLNLIENSTRKILNINSKFKYKKDNKIKNKYINNITTKILHKKDNKRKKISSHKRKHKIKKINGLIDEEINILPYEVAILYDKRTYCNYYLSLLRTKHNLIFTLNNNDYNARIIKIDLFLIGITIEYAINALFYNDDTMHKIYESKDQFDLESQLPIIIYSSLISLLLNTPLNSFALSNDEIISFKQVQSNLNLIRRVKDLKNKLTIKSIIYFILSFLLLIFFWYYLKI